MSGGHTMLGSGLSVSDGRGYSSPQRPQAFALMGGRWLAIIQGVEDGVCIRSWTGGTFERKADAVAAAQAAAISRATGEQGK